MIKFLSIIYYNFHRTFKRIKMYLLKPLFKSYGKNFIFDADSEFSYSTIEVGNDVFIGSGAKFSASESSIYIGDKVMFGPNVIIMGGDHNTSVLGEYMFDIKEKLPENDLPVIIESDVWIGAGAIILKGVSIGTGSIIGAGALINKSCPPYSIVVGVPGRIVGSRFTSEQLKVHKQLLSLSSKK